MELISPRSRNERTGQKWFPIDLSDTLRRRPIGGRVVVYGGGALSSAQQPPGIGIY